VLCLAVLLGVACGQLNNGSDSDIDSTPGISDTTWESMESMGVHFNVSTSTWESMESMDDRFNVSTQSTHTHQAPSPKLSLFLPAGC
jgi:hypothetical protein